MSLFQLLMFGSVVLARAVAAAIASIAAFPSRLRRLLFTSRMQTKEHADDGSSRTASTGDENPQQGAHLQSSSSSSSMTASIFNLVNNVAGAGLLALSASQAAGTGTVPAVVIAVALGILSAWTFILIGNACELTGEQDFKGLWGRTLGKDTTWVVDGMICILCLACCVMYSGILGDVVTPLLAQFNIVPAAYNDRTTNIVAITVALLLPMSLLKNLAALTFTSLLGFGSILYTVLFIALRALDGTYALGSGRFVTDGILLQQPPAERLSLWKLDANSLVLVSTCGLAYVAHYNAPTFYRELEHTNSPRFCTMVSASYAILVVLYVITMVAGYNTFGKSCHGNILLNYHPADSIATLGRLATGCSILFGFPFLVTGAREGLINCFSSLGFAAARSDKNHVALVVTILTFVTATACTVQNLSLLVGVTGAVMGSAIVYICPALIYTRAVLLAKGAESADYRAARWNLALVPFGVAIAALGVYMTMKDTSSVG